MEQMVESRLLCVVNVMVFRFVPHHLSYVFPSVSYRVSTVTVIVVGNGLVHPTLGVWYVLANFQCKSCIRSRFIPECYFCSEFRIIRQMINVSVCG